ncbi:hypothetical protein [Azospirillum canadense]|uniref:hypothetical protein n=1 Tax=Azospirillum canadense TaxID=403962 RepID=UPI0022272502|nr:hypothetical protein [Azospirillum canadense]MCW2240669.1 hypothetical protein [Azospirillum canadense]
MPLPSRRSTLFTRVRLGDAPARLLAILGAILLLAATPAAGKTKPSLASTPQTPPRGPAHATSAWRGGPVPGGDAKTAYCAVEAEFSNGITLSVARSRAGAVTMAMLIPNLRSSGAGSWSVTVTLDNSNGDVVTELKASVVDASAGGTIVAIPLDTIAEPQTRLSAAKTLTIDSATDRAAFTLPSGTAQALTQLTACTATMS